MPANSIQQGRNRFSREEVTIMLDAAVYGINREDFVIACSNSAIAYRLNNYKQIAEGIKAHIDMLGTGLYEHLIEDLLNFRGRAGDNEGATTFISEIIEKYKLVQL